MAPRQSNPPKGLSKRSVHNMDPVRQAKKRKADREAQARNRIRHKTLVESLQEENKNLRMMGTPQVQALALQVENLRKRMLDLQTENSKLAEKYNTEPLRPSEPYDSSIETDYASSRSTPLPRQLSNTTSPAPKTIHMTPSYSQDQLMPPHPAMNPYYTHSPSPLISENPWLPCGPEELGPTAPLDFSSEPSFKAVDCDYLGFNNFEQHAYSTQFLPDMSGFEQPYYVQATQGQQRYV